MTILEEIKNYIPFNEQEDKDKEQFLQWFDSGMDLYTRDNGAAHLTASAWVTDSTHTKLLMAYHNIYDSWSWLGGHADGERDLLHTAIREVQEESGVKNVHALTEDIFSLEVLCVEGHIRKGEYVSSHLHLNVTYLLEADEKEPLLVKKDENSAVAWFEMHEAVLKSSEPWFREHIYSKLNQKLLLWKEGSK